ncbi:hypothetical protein [uncultured Campylobacter sp.]|uniref:hypothetical protein n=1 Tax=uncultured Campylobacter sp. TaxID=218934 RepID=UPI002616822B|nr:hypothetical protein [uncultured Campylobacter sp.]
MRKHTTCRASQQTRNPKQSNSASATSPERSYAKRKFKPHSVAARTARNNKLTMLKRNVDARTARNTKARHAILDRGAALNLKSR